MTLGGRVISIYCEFPDAYGERLARAALFCSIVQHGNPAQSVERIYLVRRYLFRRLHCSPRRIIARWVRRNSDQRAPVGCGSWPHSWTLAAPIR